jgi:radical SAM protein with 4Fe4S-binding SPASM domain
MLMKSPHQTDHLLLEAKAGQTIVSHKPKEAWLALTGRCNLACLHCLRDAETASNEHVTDRVLQKVFEEVFPHLDTLLFGGNNLGEQFISRGAERVVDEAMRQGVKIAVTTNASVVRPTLIQKLVAAGAEFRLSMEGTQGAWENIRGTRWTTFEKFMHELEKARAESASGCTVTIAFTAFANNIQCLPDMIRFAKEIRASLVQVQHLLPVHPNQRFQSLSYHRTTANHMFHESETLAKALGVPLKLPTRFPVGGMDKVEGPVPNEGPPALAPCHYPWTAVNILENGDVTPCGISTTMIMGNLNKQSFDDIWNGKAYQRLRARVNTKPYGMCKNCAMRPGTNNNQAALLNILDNETLAGVATRGIKRFLLQRGRKDMIKTLTTVRDTSVRLWNSYRNDPRLLFGDLIQAVQARLGRRGDPS